MSVRIAAVLELSDEALAQLRSAVINPSTGGIAVSTTITAGRVELPESWNFLEERLSETYQWPQETDEYVTFRIYEGVTSAGKVRMALGACKRTQVRGRDRRYVITHYLTPGGSKRPIAEFLEADDNGETGDMIAIIKGKGGSAKMYDPTDDLPPEYQGFRIETYRDRIDARGSYEKLGIVAHEDDFETMLAHTLIQAQSRFGLGPS